MKTRILVVDDDINLLRLMQIALENTGLYSVHAVNLPTQALQDAREFKPDLIILDVNMPGMDGGDVARLIRADESLKETKIVFFTSLLAEAESGKELVMRGGDYFMAKPFNVETLTRSVEAFVTAPFEQAA